MPHFLALPFACPRVITQRDLVQKKSLGAFVCGIAIVKNDVYYKVLGDILPNHHYCTVHYGLLWPISCLICHNGIAQYDNIFLLIN
jgi:hypothetical protein